MKNNLFRTVGDSSFPDFLKKIFNENNFLTL